MKVRRILSIDGGGIKGVFPAAFLASLEKDLTNPIGSYFDLIAGTSTGGIIALGLGLGLSAGELLELYEKHGQKIFEGNRFYKWLKSLGFAKYDTNNLKTTLTTHFGNRLLGESKTRLVIPAMNLDTGEAFIYKTSHHPRLITDHKAPIIEVALSTSAAPTFFPTYFSSKQIPLVDGGVWANNPVGIAVIEAIGVLEWPRESLRVLSIGCTCEPFDAGIRRKFPLGKIPWAVKAADLFMAGQSTGALGMAGILAGKENVTRINVYANSGRYGLDLYKEIKSLRGLGESEARKASYQLKPVFFETPAEKFEPIYQCFTNTATSDSE